MKANLVAQRYAKALFEVASEQKNVDAVSADLSLLVGIFKDEELQNYFSSPVLSDSKKQEILDRLIQAGKFSPSTENFLKVLAQRSRMQLLAEVEQSFTALSDESKGIVRGTLSSAKDLNESEKTDLLSKVEKALGKKIILEFRKDPSILGGAIVNVGDYTIDFSIGSQLNQIKESLNVGAH